MEDGPINAKTIEDTLKGIGVKTILKDKDVIRFATQDAEYCLEYGDIPHIHLSVMYFIEDAFKLELAKKTANQCNCRYLDIMIHVDDARWCAFKSMTFASGIHALSEALPHMMTYLEEARIAFLYNYQKNLDDDLKLMAVRNNASMLS